MDIAFLLKAEVAVDDARLDRGLEQAERKTKNFDQRVSGSFDRMARSAKGMGETVHGAAARAAAANDNVATSARRAALDMDKVAGSARRYAAILSGAATVAAGALMVAVRRSINLADETSKMAQRLGMGVEDLSRFRHAADLSGISVSELATSVSILSRNMASSMPGASNDATKALASLGISVTDTHGKLRSNIDVMADVAREFAGMEDGAKKTALAMDIFGRSGGQLIPLLNAGAVGFRDMMTEADRLGIVIDGRTAKAAEAFNDNLTRLGRVKDGFVTRITAQMVPALELLSEKIFEFTANENAVRSAVEGMGSAIQWGARQFAHLALVAARLNVEIRGLMDAFSKLGSGDFSGAWDSWMRGQDESARMRDELDKLLSDAFSGSAVSQGAIQRTIDAAHAAGQQAGTAFTDGLALTIGAGSIDHILAGADTSAARLAGSAAGGGSALGKAAREAERLIKAYDGIVASGFDFIAQQRLEASVLGMTDQAANALRYSQDCLGSAKEGEITLSAEQRNAINDLAAAYEQENCQ